MTGAGISTSAGIPDFRSPDTGLYANLARLDLPYAEAVFDISYFREHPEPFYVLAKELYPGKFYPTIAHSFIALLEKKGLLDMAFTQNIDCLERRAGVPGEKIVEAHGSFATQRCIDCKTEYPENLMLKAIHSAEVPHCTVPQCNGIVKPDIVFFGESLPESFFRNRLVPTTADLIIVMGTSLSVRPFASLPQLVPGGVPRVLFNLEIVGDFGSRPDDVVVLGDCDSGVRKLADALGWRDELEASWMEVGGKEKEKEAARLRAERQAMSSDEILAAEIEKLTAGVDEALKLGKDHIDWVNEHLDKVLIKGEPAAASPTVTAVSQAQDAKDYETTSTGLPASVEDVKEQGLSTPSTTDSEEFPSARPGMKEPPSTPAVHVNIPLNTEKVVTEASSQNPAVDKEAILDVTLPQNRPDIASSGSGSDQKPPNSHI